MQSRKLLEENLTYPRCARLNSLLNMHSLYNSYSTRSAYLKRLEWYSVYLLTPLMCGQTWHSYTIDDRPQLARQWNKCVKHCLEWDLSLPPTIPLNRPWLNIHLGYVYDYWHAWLLSFKRPLLSVDMSVCLSVSVSDTLMLNTSKTQLFRG